MKKNQLVVAFLLCMSIATKSQDNDNKTIEADLGADIVSSYVWRGLCFDPAVNIQPWFELAAGNFAIGTWGSFNTQGTYIEPDIYVSYTLSKLKFTLTDVHGNGGADYFNFKKDETKHTGEIMVNFDGGELLPLKLTASMLIYGDDKKIEGIDLVTDTCILSNDNNYSTYFEIGYSHTLKNDVTIDFFAGFVPTESYYYNATGFAFINLGIKASKEIKINENFKLPISLSIVNNPNTEIMFFVFGLSL